MKPRSLGTHDGTFHADEVTACGLLLTFDLIDRDKILRSRDQAKLQECEYVCDVGGVYNSREKRFDHHQVDYMGEMSSAGMVLLYLKPVIGDQLYHFLNRSLVLGVDAHDNGRVVLETGVCTFSQVITNFVPPAYDAPPEVIVKAFFEAVDFVHGHLKRLIDRYRYIEACREVVVETMRKKETVLVFEKAMPWMDVFFEMEGEKHPALFIVMPSGTHWKLRGIPPNTRERMQVRKPLPESWAGLMGDDLKKKSGVEGAIFCHKGRFISVWETKEDVMKALDVVLKKK